ncbi:MAG: nitrite reductase large subunit NirB, partial [Gammaproteobacteria bacterium]|nr:nitrite reductase large subunit NirB [Gammaproteobacteria bacterium]
MKEQLVVIGNGMAPGRMLESLFESDPNRYDVTIFNSEPRVNYNRLMLSHVLSGEKNYQDIITHDDSWYAAHNVTLHKNTPINSIDLENKCVVADDDSLHSYDKLVIATGSSPIMIPIPGHDLPGVMVYRDLDDVEEMLKAADSHSKAVVIGGGLLGLEAAAGLHAQGMQVTVVHLAEHLMEKQLDKPAGLLLEAAMKKRGIDILTGANTTAINGIDSVSGVTLKDGTHLSADLVVMAVGIRPSTSLAEAAGLAVNRGIVVNDQMCTSSDSVYALGECAEHRDICYGLVAPLYDMATVLANTLLEQQSEYQGSITATKLKVSGIDLFSAGEFLGSADVEEIVIRDAARGVYRRLVLKEHRIVGVVLYGDTSDSAWFLDLLKQKTDISDMRTTLIFGQSYQGETDLDPTAAVAALADSAEICGCNGICKSRIVGAINNGEDTLEGVRSVTKASSSCGSCTGLVEQLLSLTLGDRYARSAVQALCGCTDLGHADVRRLIKAKTLKTIDQVMQELEWRSSCGCAKCRPALNYYLVCEWPAEYRDDYQSRFINERVHANIQKDGTFSVVPRMWGGVTSADELRAIADVVDKFDVPMVKVTGGQRIDMLGIKKENLPAIWNDLGKAGFVSGHAYAKGLRTVKTCVGKQWCRFGTQDSTGLGVRLEKFLWGSWTPAKVKLAVSGCPRNCAEATCKDIGVVCVESGFDLHFAGAAGLDIKGTELLGHVDTEDAVEEHVAALLQMYREQ